MKNIIKAVYRIRLHGIHVSTTELFGAFYFSDKYRNQFMKKPSESEVTNTYLIQPPQTNLHGTAFGGQIMAWMDETAAIAALRHCNMPCVTVSVDKVEFSKPIRMGHILIMKARVNATGKTSVEVGVRICSENPLTGERQHCLSGYFTFVGVDADGKSTEVPVLQPDSAEDIRRYKEAMKRREVRLSSRIT